LTYVTAMLKVAAAVLCVFGLPDPVSRTSTLKVEVAAFLDGVPEMVPVDLSSERPLGSFEPDVNFHVYGGFPPAAVSD
jgi:hypothetical protein